jgi:hypothetical protein
MLREAQYPVVTFHMEFEHDAFYHRIGESAQTVLPCRSAVYRFAGTTKSLRFYKSGEDEPDQSR